MGAEGPFLLYENPSTRFIRSKLSIFSFNTLKQINLISWYVKLAYILLNMKETERIGHIFYAKFVALYEDTTKIRILGI